MTTSTFVSSTNATVHQSSFKARYWGDANSLRFLAENARTIDGKSAHWHLRARLRYWNVQQEGFRQQRVVNSPQHGQRYPGKRSQNDSWTGEKWQRGIRVGKGTMASNFAACFERSLWDKLNGQNSGSWSSHDDGVPFPRRWRHPNLGTRRTVPSSIHSLHSSSRKGIVTGNIKKKVLKPLLGHHFRREPLRALAKICKLFKSTQKKFAIAYRAFYRLRPN